MASIKIKGDTSGSTTITAPATGSDETIELSTELASKLPYSYGTATPSTTDSGFLWYDSNSTPPTPKFWDGAAFQDFDTGVGDWQTWTPTISSSSGTITSYNILVARYLQSNKLVICLLDFEITNNGTGAGNMLVTLPVTAAGNQRGFGSGLERSATGNQLQCQNQNTTTWRMNTYNNNYPGGTNYRINAGYVYEAA